MRRYIAVLGIPLILVTVSCEQLIYTHSDSSHIGSSESSTEPDSSIHYLPDTGATKLRDVEPRGALGDRYVEIPNSDVILYEDEYYTDVDEVAAYLQFFDRLPDNCVLDRNDVKRNNEYFFTNGYFGNREGILPQGGGITFTEIDLRSGYSWSGQSLQNRGVHRIVFAQDRTDDVVAVYVTYNHYETFQEYLCYYGGWGEEYGEDSSNGYRLESAKVGNYVYLDEDTIIYDWDFSL